MVPAYAIGVGTLFGTPDGQPPVAGNRMESLLILGGPTGIRHPYVTAMYQRGTFKKHIEVVVPGLDRGEPWDDVDTEIDALSGSPGIGEVALQFRHSGLPAFRISFSYWKNRPPQSVALEQARHFIIAIDRWRAGRATD